MSRAKVPFGDRKPSLPWAALMLVAALAPALAEEAGCRDEETVDSCIERLATTPEDTRAAEDDRAAETVKRNAQEGLTRALFSKSAGVDVPASALGSALKDFLPLFRIAAESGDLGQEEASVSADINLPVFGQGDRDFKIQVVLHEAALFDPLREALPAATREARAAELEDGLDDFDDYSIVLTWNRMSERFGRSIAKHGGEGSRLLLELMSNVEAGHRSAAERLGLRMRDENIDPSAKLSELPETLKREIAEAIKGEEELDRLVDEEAAAKKFFRLADLINNQPQLNVTLERRARSDLVGADETSLKISFEMGFANVNRLKKWCRGNGFREVSLSCLSSYAGDEKNEKAFETGNRLSFSLEASQADDYTIALPNDMVALDLEFERKLKASLAYGRYLFVDEEGKDRARLDVSAAYEEFGDEKRQDRAVAAVSYTQKISDAASLVFGVSWANKEEFLPDVRDRLNAHLGLSYKLLGEQKAASAGK